MLQLNVEQGASTAEKHVIAADLEPELISLPDSRRDTSRLKTPHLRRIQAKPHMKISENLITF